MSLPKSSVAPEPSPRFYTLIMFVVVVAVLRIAEDVMIPVALALLLAFLLSPLVVRLRRWRLPKALAITVTVAFAFGVLIVAAWQIAGQAMSLLDELPRYEANLHRKIGVLKRPETSGSLSRAFVTLEAMWTDLQAPAPAAAGVSPSRHDPTTPVAVEVHAIGRSSFDVMRGVVTRLFNPLSTAGIVAVFVVAILFQREDLRSRFIRVISGGQLNIATEAVDDAAQRVSRYLLAQLLVNACFGVGIGTGLYFIGIPHAPLWGLLSMLLRFIPFLGPLIAVVFPLVLAIAIDPGWSMVSWTIGLFVVAELLTNNVVEVLVYGTSTGISTLALLTAAVFWSWLWGAAGLLLSTPLTVCLLVIGQYVPGLKFLGVLLGSEPPLAPSADFYQSMLSMDHEEMFNAAEVFVEERSLADFYDDVFVPALLMAEVDRHNGRLAEVRQKFIFESSRELIEELGQRSPAASSPTPPGPPPSVRESGATAVPVILGLPARDEADELVALMLAHLLRDAGLAVTVTAATAALGAHRHEPQAPRPIVFVSALPPSTLSAAARATRRIKQTNPDARVLVGVWSSQTRTEDLKHRLEPAGADAIVTRLNEAVLKLTSLAASPAREAASAPAPGGCAAERAGASLAPLKPEDAVDTVVRELARSFDVPISLVSVLEVDRDFWKHPGDTTALPFAIAENPVFDEVLAGDSFLVVADLAKDERLSTHPLLVKRGVRFLVTTPLRTRAGHLVGNLCVLDTKSRTFSDADKQRLLSLAVQLMQSVDPPGSPTAPATV